jgi:hypothetical protein
LKLPTPLSLPEKTRVRVTLECADPAEDGERSAWLRHSEATLTTVWDNAADDVFNALRPR